MKNLSRGGRQVISKIPETNEILDFLGSTSKNLLNESDLIYTKLNSPTKISIEKDQAKHLVSALRTKTGEYIRIIDPETNLVGQGTLEELEKNTYCVKLEFIGKSILNYPDIAIGLPEQKTLEACIEKLTELGASSISFFQAEYSQTKQGNLNLARLYKKRDAAVKQSYSLCVPKISVFESLDKAIEKTKTSKINLISLYSPKDKEELDLENIKIHDIEWLILNKQKNLVPKLLCIGPEGGFSKKELRLLINQESSFVSLGKNTLRVETAASLGLACLNSSPHYL